MFDKLRITRTSRGPFIFLEEDHYVAPDFFHSLNLLHKLKERFVLSNLLHTIPSMQCSKETLYAVQNI